MESELNYLKSVWLRSRIISKILERAPELKMPNWYLGAGCVNQTIWNEKHGFPLEQNIKDCDLVYFDADDISYEGEDLYIQKAKNLFADLPVPVEIRNQARVHLWYKNHFGYDIPPHTSAEAAINSWPTTATAIGLRQEKGKLITYAPFGLDDILNMVVRPNKTKVTPEIYQEKTSRWKKCWPKLTICSWEQGVSENDIPKSSQLRYEITL